MESGRKFHQVGTMARKALRLIEDRQEPGDCGTSTKWSPNTEPPSLLNSVMVATSISSYSVTGLMVAEKEEGGAQSDVGIQPRTGEI